MYLEAAPRMHETNGSLTHTSGLPHLKNIEDRRWRAITSEALVCVLNPKCVSTIELKIEERR